MANQQNGFVGFEYMEVPTKRSMESLYVDGYQNFGWEYEGTFTQGESEYVTMKFKRNRKIRNKAELSRLQRQFESCAHEIEALEQSQTTTATIAAFSIGLAGTALMGGSMFAYLNGMLPLMVILAIPGFLGWIIPYFCYRKLQSTKALQIAPIIEQKNDEIYAVCEQGCNLLTV
ncbi:MAG: hypothetical protein KHY46_15585 [Clostridiales bacterium]|nr:hypothetical protein [Clostridiales bacterium]